MSGLLESHAGEDIRGYLAGAGPLAPSYPGRQSMSSLQRSMIPRWKNAWSPNIRLASDAVRTIFLPKSRNGKQESEPEERVSSIIGHLNQVPLVESAG